MPFRDPSCIPGPQALSSSVKTTWKGEPSWLQLVWGQFPQGVPYTESRKKDPRGKKDEALSNFLTKPGYLEKGKPGV